MTASEAARLALSRKLEQVLGTEDAVTLLDSLPPGRDRVATGTDVGRLDTRMDQLDGRMGQLEGRMDRLEGRIDRLEDRMERLEDRMTSLERSVHQQFRTMIVALVGSNATIAGLAFAAARLV